MSVASCCRPFSRSTEKTTRLSVIAPCLNEEANVDLLVQRTLAAFDAMAVGAEIILVDDGSTDGTWERIRDCGRQDRRVRGVRHEQNRGMEAGWRSGLAAARGECVCLIDADLQNRPEDIALLYEAFERGWGDVIQAVRHAVAIARHRCMFTSGLNRLLNGAFGMHSRDNKSGFILCRRDVLADILRHRGRYRYYQSFIGAAAHVRGYRLCEVDTVFDGRHGGQSFLRRPIRASMRIVWEIAKFRAETWRERRPELEPNRLASPGGVQTPAIIADVEGWNDAFARENDIDQYYEASGPLIRWIEERRLEAIRRMIDPRPGEKLLEVGCGGGHVLRMFPECELTGVDVSGEMLAKARRNLAGYRVELLKGELGDLDLPTAGFDKIICTEVLEHAVDPEGILEQMSRLLKPTGTAVVTFPNDRLVELLKSMIRRCGLTFLPPLRRISWGGDHYHLHRWPIRQMRDLLGRRFIVTAESIEPSRLLPIRCCFRCTHR